MTHGVDTIDAMAERRSDDRASTTDAVAQTVAQAGEQGSGQVSGQGGETIERSRHLGRRSLEQATAAQAEQGIAAKQAAVAVKRDMAGCVAGYFQHLEAQFQGGQIKPVAFLEALVLSGDPAVVWAIHGRPGLPDDGDLDIYTAASFYTGASAADT